MSRNRRIGRSQLKLYGTDFSCGVIGRVSLADGTELEAKRAVHRVYDRDGRHVGYQFAAVQAQREWTLTPSSSVISASERDCFVGLRGVTKVEGDAVDNAVRKVKAYPTLAGEAAWRADVRARVAKARA